MSVGAIELHPALKWYIFHRVINMQEKLEAGEPPDPSTHLCATLTGSQLPQSPFVIYYLFRYETPAIRSYSHFSRVITERRETSTSFTCLEDSIFSEAQPLTAQGYDDH